MLTVLRISRQGNCFDGLNGRAFVKKKKTKTSVGKCIKSFSATSERSAEGLFRVRKIMSILPPCEIEKRGRKKNHTSALREDFSLFFFSLIHIWPRVIVSMSTVPILKKKEKVQLNGNKTGENNEIPQLQQLRRILSLQVNGGVHIHAYSCI